MARMTRINVYLPNKEIERIAKVIQAELFPNRNEFIRAAIRDKLEKMQIT